MLVHFYFRTPAGGSVGARLWQGGDGKFSEAVRMGQEMDAVPMLRCRWRDTETL